LTACPWDDPSWELWGHASSRPWYKREADLYFDLHRRECWDSPGKRVYRYPEWLAINTVPIYMWEKYPEVPASRPYPKERILIEYGGARRYFKNHLAWMIALAFTEGVTHLGLFGTSYQTEQERQNQRGSAEYWLGRAEERGVQLVLPNNCSLLAEPAGLYGYESHDENGLLLPQWKLHDLKPSETIRPLRPGEERPEARPPAHLIKEIKAEEATRPDWAKSPDWTADWPDRTDGGLAKDA
jgi:hypothetical protein